MKSAETKPRLINEAAVAAVVGMVQQHGDAQDVATWQRTFPSINFGDSPDKVSVYTTPWADKNLTERALFVLWKQSNQSLSAKIAVDTRLNHLELIVNQCDQWWWLWLCGAFAHLTDPLAHMSEEGLREIVRCINPSTDELGIDEEIIPSHVIDLEIQLSQTGTR